MSDTPHPTDVRVGRLLRERRLELGISQERLGGLLGVTYQQVQKYERGTNRIGSSRLHELCGILGVRASYFFDEPTPQGLAEAPAAFDHAPALSASTIEGRHLLEAFERISDAELRHRILDLTRTLASRERARDAGDT
jgi:transcriptional regulator with XRE-family HTH domain